MSLETTIYPARKIITMHPGLPEADAVAVRDGRILGVGTVDELKGWGSATVDRRFADLVITPGLIEAHLHASEGGFWQFTYCGYFDRQDPDKIVQSGSTSVDALIERLKAVDRAMADPSQPLIGWGLDPIYFPGARLSAADLDKVSETRPILIVHASLHVMTVNSVVLRECDITSATTMAGVIKDANGDPAGELQEFSAMGLTLRFIGIVFSSMQNGTALKNLGAIARNVGCTTLAELGSLSLDQPQILDLWKQGVDDPTFPARVVAFYGNSATGPTTADKIIPLVQKLKQEQSEKFRIGGVKIWLDGSLQGFTSRLNWPYYYKSMENGTWNTPPDQVAEIVSAYHQAGIHVNAHCNGDQAIELFIAAVDQAMNEHSWLDHRFVIQHCQMTTPEQYRRMARLGICANIFAKHIYYWGDQHAAITLGPERAAKLDAAATALREGISVCFHSDANVTPLGQLESIWCAVNRVTASGRALGAEERISAYDALHAVTAEAAFQLRLEDEIGTISAGKRADFTILGDDPLAVDSMTLRDIPVWGTVIGGIPHEAVAGG
jgi:predicted amidohydrolase YtcJ